MNRAEECGNNSCRRYPFAKRQMMITDAGVVYEPRRREQNYEKKKDFEVAPAIVVTMDLEINRYVADTNDKNSWR
jgi:hypothetical protein